jgi:hypothetical protein
MALQPVICAFLDEGARRARNFLHSRLMCRVAFDRATRIARDSGLPAPLDEWQKISAGSTGTQGQGAGMKRHEALSSIMAARPLTLGPVC